MKTRTGFVSNSSSSSFVVRRSDTGSINSKKSLTTPQQDRLLQKYGFRKIIGWSPDCVPCNKKEWKAEEKLVQKLCNSSFRYNLGYEVTCNQDGVMVFLIENKIPFVADCHYGHYTWIYTPELDRIIVATNVGRIMEMYGDLETYDTKDVVRVLKASEWAEKEKNFWGNAFNKGEE